MISNIIITIILIAFWAFFAGAETAFISTNKIKLKTLKQKNNKRAIIAYFLIEKPERLLTTTLIGTNICLVPAANLTALTFFKIFESPKPFLSLFTITILSLIVCEILPKNLGIKKSLSFTLNSAIPMYFFYIVFYPFGKLFSYLVTIIVRVTGYRYTGFGPRIFSQKRDLKILLRTTLRNKFKRDHTRFFFETLDIGKRIIGDIMVPLVEIKGIDVNSSFQKVVSYFKKNKTNFAPVYEGRVDNIIGVVFSSDVLEHREAFSLRQVIKKPVFVPENKKIHELYKEMYEKDIPVVFTVDEHGGVTGMITPYDIGAEVVGELGETKFHAPTLIRVSENEFLCSGELPFDILIDNLGIEIPEEGFTNINGFLLKEFGRIPVAGEFIDRAGYRFIIENSTERKIILVRIKKLVD